MSTTSRTRSRVPSADDIEVALEIAGFPLVLKVSEAARATGLSAAQVRRYAASGVLIGMRSASPGGHLGSWRFLRRHVAEFICGASGRGEGAA